MTSMRRHLAWAILAALISIWMGLFTPITLVAESNFRSPVVISSASPGTFFMVVSDLDQDGDSDIVVASSANDSVTWYENSGATGEVWIPHLVSSVADGVVRVRVADIDRDGDLDVVSASTLDDKLRWHENLLGNGLYWNDHSVGVEIDGIIGIVVEDFDQDLDWDVAAVSNLDNKVLWFENTTGDASDGMIHVIQTSALGAFTLEKGDLDGDGDIDLISGWSNGILAWHENMKNQGGSWVNHVIGSNLGNIRSIAADDINGDGALDVSVASADLDSIFWFQAVEISQGIWQRNTVTTNLDGVVFIDTVDVDNDGDIDILAAADVARTFSVFSNGSGLGSNWSGSVISAPALGGVHQNMTNGPRVVRSADVNGDGLQDIITGSYWGQTVAVLIQRIAANSSNPLQGSQPNANAPTSTPTPTPVPSGVVSDPLIEETSKPVPVVVLESDMVMVDTEMGVAEIIHPTASSEITVTDQCASLKIHQPSWESTFQVKVMFEEVEAVPLMVSDRSLCIVDIRTYDAQAVYKGEMELWQPATIRIPLSTSILQRASQHGINGATDVMNAIGDRRLVLVKRYEMDSSYWVPIATHMDLLGGTVTTTQTNLAGTYALIVLEETIPADYVLPSVGYEEGPLVIAVMSVLGLFALVLGGVLRGKTRRKHG